MTATSDATSAQLVPATPAHAAELRALYVRNRAFLTPWFPAWNDSWFSLERRRAELEQDERAHVAGTGYHFLVMVDGAIAGRVNLTNVVRGVWQNATVGYWMSEDRCGKGHMTQALRAAVCFAFEDAALHRLQAAVMPRNGASLRLLEKVGFRREGVSLRYLLINGAWEDHVIHAMTVEDWRAAAR